MVTLERPVWRLIDDVRRGPEWNQFTCFPDDRPTVRRIGPHHVRMGDGDRPVSSYLVNRRRCWGNFHESNRLRFCSVATHEGGQTSLLEPRGARFEFFGWKIMEAGLRGGEKLLVTKNRRTGQSANKLGDNYALV